MMTDMTAFELGKLVRSKEISVSEIIEEIYERFLERDKTINAYTEFDFERIKQSALNIQYRIDNNELGTALAGVPIAIKDNICTRGEYTTCGSKILRKFRSPFDATVIEKAKNEGMVIAGKLNMDEFAMGSTSETSHYGPVRNPWNTRKVPGGSSGGAAAAVACGEAICALGSDTGGSIRQPASYCGVTGFKPSYGFVSRYGLIAYASSLDQIGPIARDVLDCAAIMDVISGKDIMDSTSISIDNRTAFVDSLTGKIDGITIGIPDECFDEGVDCDVRIAVEKTIAELEKLGAKTKRVSLPFIRYAVPAYYIIATAEASSNLSRFDGIKYGYRSEKSETIDELVINSRSEGFGSEVRKRILLGTFVLSSGYYDAYYKTAMRTKEKIVDGFNSVFRDCDVIICPTAPSTAPELGCSLGDGIKMYLSDIFTVSVNLAGLPGLSVPCGFDNKQMPIGAQIIGSFGNDKTVLNVGYAFQKATDYHTMRPKPNS